MKKIDMFKKLRLRLILVNLTIIFSIFLALEISVYIFFNSDMENRSKDIIRKVTNDILTGKTADIVHNDFIPPIFFVKTDKAGNITFASQAQPQEDFTQHLLNYIWQRTKDNGNVSYGNRNFFFAKTPLPDGWLVVFDDRTAPKKITNYILNCLSICAVIFFVLSFLASLFLANRAIIPIKKNWQQQKDFLANISHELRTPLAIIMTNLDIIKRSPPDSQQYWLDGIKAETDDMTKLVSSLLFLARADANQHLFEKKIVYLNELIDSSIKSFLPLALKKRIQLASFSDQACTVSGDYFYLKKVLGIMLDNAIKYTFDGGHIDVRLTQVGQNSLITISDTGEGIKPEYLVTIFDRFNQAANRSRSSRGTGLGLAIAKWIISQHCGSIHVASVPGTGTTFTIKLPLCY